MGTSAQTTIDFECCVCKCDALLPHNCSGKVFQCDTCSKFAHTHCIVEYDMLNVNLRDEIKDHSFECTCCRNRATLRSANGVEPPAEVQISLAAATQRAGPSSNEREARMRERNKHPYMQYSETKTFHYRPEEIRRAIPCGADVSMGDWQIHSTW